MLLPPQFNDGRDVPTEWIAETVLEIVDHFGAASYETQKVEATGARTVASLEITWCE